MEQPFDALSCYTNINNLFVLLKKFSTFIWNLSEGFASKFCICFTQKIKKNAEDIVPTRVATVCSSFDVVPKFLCGCQSSFWKKTIACHV